MRLRQIELFHAVLTTGSLTGAAELLNISQPAASKALQHAEQQLGFALFSRVRGRLQPTQEALLLRHRVDRIAQELRDLERLTTNIGRPESAPLRVTCTPTLAQTVVPNVTAALCGTSPRLTAELATQHSAAMCESLMLHETDIGLTLQDSGHPTLRHKSLCRGQIMVIAPPGWWPQEDLEKPLPISELAGQPMIGITVQDALGSMLQSQLAQVTPGPKTTIWVQTYQLAHALVSRGIGLALVDPFTAGSGTTLPVQTRALKLQLTVTLYAIHRVDSPLSALQKRFIDLVQRAAQNLLTRA